MQYFEVYTSQSAYDPARVSRVQLQAIKTQDTRTSGVLRRKKQQILKI